MGATKIRLSPPEMELLMNTEWILTKNRILEKTNQLMGRLLEQQQQFLQQHFQLLPPEVMAAGAKLSKGDNYKGLPYRILDHPRCFSNEGFFAIRSFFWWGNFFSSTLLLSGKYQTALLPALQRSFEQLRQNGYYYCIQQDPWLHHFEADNYIPLSAMTASHFEQENRTRPFLKLAKKIPLQEWDQAADKLQNAFMELTGIVDN